MVSLTLSKKEMGFHWVRFIHCGSVNVKTASPLDNVISLN